jgi:hypothetical protein
MCFAYYWGALFWLGFIAIFIYYLVSGRTAYLYGQNLTRKETIVFSIISIILFLICMVVTQGQFFSNPEMPILFRLAPTIFGAILAIESLWKAAKYY